MRWKEYLKYIRDNPKGYWFKRRLYRWGWTPVTWQGWAVTLGLLGLIVLNAFRIDAAAHSASDAAMNLIPQTFALIFLLIVIAWRTGEPPKWQWGPPRKDASQTGFSQEE